MADDNDRASIQDTKSEGDRNVAVSAPPQPAKKREPRTKKNAMRPIPSMPASQDAYYSRKELPMMLENFRVPVYMREKLCRLTDNDEANSGLQLMTCQLKHADIEKVFGVVPQFSSPFVLVLPVGIRLSPESEELDVITFIATHMRQNYPSIVSLHEPNIAALRFFYSKTISEEACLGMRAPWDIAAAVLVAFHLFNPFFLAANADGTQPRHDEAAMRAGAFLANIILLAEGMRPLRASDISSPALAVACATDNKTWNQNPKMTEVSNACTRAYIKKVPRACHACGKIAKMMKKCTRCHVEHYCGAECQTTDWVRHKPFCTDNRNARAAQKTTQ